MDPRFQPTNLLFVLFLKLICYVLLKFFVNFRSTQPRFRKSNNRFSTLWNSKYISATTITTLYRRKQWKSEFVFWIFYFFNSYFFVFSAHLRCASRWLLHFLFCLSSTVLPCRCFNFAWWFEKRNDFRLSEFQTQYFNFHSTFSFAYCNIFKNLKFYYFLK